MRDPLTVLAEQAAAALGVQPELDVDVTEFSVDAFLEWATRAELELMLEALRRLSADGAVVSRGDALSIVDPAVVRAVQLRRALGLGVRVDAAPGVDAHIRRRACIEASPRMVDRCRCAERAIGEVAAEVQRVDAAAVKAARARAEVLHGVRRARLERARAWLRRRAPAVAVPPRVKPGRGGRRVVGLADVGIPDGLIAEADAVAVVQGPVRRSVSRRSWAVARGRVAGGDDEFGREVARLAGVSYSTSTWRALPTVDAPPRDAS